MNTNHTTLAIEDEQARVTLVSKQARLLVIVIDGEFDGLDAKVIAKVGHEAGVPSDSDVGGVSILHDDKAGFAVAVETVRNIQELTRDTTIDP